MFHCASSWSKNLTLFFFLYSAVNVYALLGKPFCPHVVPTCLDSRSDKGVVQVPITVLAGEGGGKAVVAPSLAVRDVQRGLRSDASGGESRTPADWKSSEEPRWLVLNSAIFPSLAPTAGPLSALPAPRSR